MKGPLQHATFRWLLIGRNIDALGNSVAPVALAFAVRDISHSATDLGIVVASRSLTNVLLLLFGGVVADRFPRRLVVVSSAAAAAVTQAAIAALVLTGNAEIWSLAVIGALNGAVAAVAFPASAAMVSQTVSEDELQRANTLLRIGLNVTGLLGIAIGVQLVAIFGPGVGIAIDAASFALSALAFTHVRLAPVPPPPRSTVVADLREGWGEFVSRRWVWVIVAQFGVVNAASSGVRGVLAPTVADETFGRHAYGVVLTVFTVGLLVGSLIALRIKPRRALLFGTSVILLEALPTLGLALTPHVVPLSIEFFLAALAFDQFGIAWDLSLQENVPADRLARVYSYDALGSFIAIPLGQVIVGPFASVFGVKATLYGCAVAIVVPTLWAIADRSVRTLERRVPELTQAAA